jgi:hypothetical protein
MSPASPEMIALGCTCDQEENRNGAGIEGLIGENGEPLFHPDKNCPFHFEICLQINEIR